MNENLYSKKCKFVCVVCRGSSLILVATALTVLVGFFVMGWFQHSWSSENAEGLLIEANYGGVDAERLRIGLALILSAILMLTTNISKKIKAIPLVWIIGEYILWGINTRGLFAGVSEEIAKNLPRLLFLYSATWLDVVILFVSLASFICLFMNKQSLTENS